MPLEQVIEEQRFARTLEPHADPFFRLAASLLSLPSGEWSKKHTLQLINEADDLESVLDDYGARYNRAYCFFTELVASVRGFANVGYSLSHLVGRLGSYGVVDHVSEDDSRGLARSLRTASEFVEGSIRRMLEAARREATSLGVAVSEERVSEGSLSPPAVRQKLPRNVGEEVIEDERQKIAEVATKFLQACELLDELGVRHIEDVEDRRRFLAEACTEEQARVYEATVHNLQSTYDTYIKNTVLEGRDTELPLLRGFASIGLHLLEAVTLLVHFHERHESEIRSERAKQQISEIVGAGQVQAVVLNHLLYWAERFMGCGREVAEGLLRAYTNLQELEAELLPGVSLHARPAALIVGIVNHYGTPVEMEVGGQRASAGSILELLVAVGSAPDQRRFVFRGDENPLRDIGLLFESGLAESGVDSLPDALRYLRGGK
jgi:phosphotransferase system HPr-like phosphotransfer protein